MRVPRPIAPFTLVLVSVVSVAASQDGKVTASPELLEGRYCADGPNGMTFNGRIRFVIENGSQTRILMPRFSQLSSYQLFPKSGSGGEVQPEREERYRIRELFDVSALDGAAPPPALFDTLEPGATQVRILEVDIPLIPARRPGDSLLGRVHFLHAEINNWFSAKSRGERLQAAWKSFGHLQIEPLRARPLELRLEERPVRQQCRNRID